MTRLYLGVDAGNSKTVAVLCDARGAVRGWGRAGIGDIYGASDEQSAVENVLLAAREALDSADAGTSGAAVTTASFCLAGADWPEDHTFWREVLAARLPELARVTVRNDGFATLRAGVADGVGLAVAVGTGPAVVARGAAGEERCLGWWCFDHLGGSGLVAGALRAVYLAHQGLAPATTLTDVLPPIFDAPDVVALRHMTTRRDEPVAVQGHPGSARAVLLAAQQGDLVATALVQDQARAFAGYASWVARQAGFDVVRDAVPVVLGGSVVTSDVAVLRTALEVELREWIPGAVTHVIDRPPVLGAVIQAVADDRASAAVDFAASLDARSLPSAAVTTD